MYCPKCFNNTLNIGQRGVVGLIINNKQMDAGRFLFSFEPEREEDIVSDFTQKVDEFFSWYSTFTNKEPIYYIELITGGVKCTNGCKLPPEQKYSIIDILISRTTIKKILRQMSEKYKMPVQLKN